MGENGFYIGRVRLANPFILAPLAGVTNLPFRRLAKEQGAGLTVSEMVSAMGLRLGAHKTIKLMAAHESETPFSIQLFGKDPETLAEAAKIAVDHGADIIDLNLGCPARKVVRHGSGAALLKDFKQIEAILTAMRRAVSVPLTVKTRLGWRPGDPGVLDLAPILNNCGVDAVTVHGRFGNQGFSGRADWADIARLKSIFHGPVIGNGDVTAPEKALARLQEAGCDGVMIGRAAMGSPWIFRSAWALHQGRPDPGVSLIERRDAAFRHADMLMTHIGDLRAVYMLRSVLMWYTKGLPGSSAFRGAINQVHDYGRLQEAMSIYFDQLRDREAAGA